MDPNVIPTSWEGILIWCAGWFLLELRHYVPLFRRWLEARAIQAELQRELAQAELDATKSQQNLLEHKTEVRDENQK